MFRVLPVFVCFCVCVCVSVCVWVWVWVIRQGKHIDAYMQTDTKARDSYAYKHTQTHTHKDTPLVGSRRSAGVAGESVPDGKAEHGPGTASATTSLILFMSRRTYDGDGWQLWWWWY